MPKYELVVLTNAKPDRDEEFNAWYDNTHVHDIVALDAFTGADRYEWRAGMRPGGPAYKYMAIYHAEAPDAETALNQIREAARNGMSSTDAMEADSFIHIYERRERP